MGIELHRLHRHIRAYWTYFWWKDQEKARKTPQEKEKQMKTKKEIIQKKRWREEKERKVREEGRKKMKFTSEWFQSLETHSKFNNNATLNKLWKREKVPLLKGRERGREEREGRRGRESWRGEKILRCWIKENCISLWMLNAIWSFFFLFFFWNFSNYYRKEKKKFSHSSVIPTYCWLLLTWRVVTFDLLWISR